MGSILIGIIVIVVIAYWIWAEYSKANNEDKAREAYHKALRQLRNDPNNPNLRENTLRLGRSYSELTRDSQGHSVIDEVSIMNDINAACAGRVAITNPIAISGQSVAKEIEKLASLFQAGIITAEEFDRGKTLFLGAPPDKAASAVELLKNLYALRKSGVISESEFNMKKWEILSERLIPGKLQAARL